jgi:hypothetical protein
VTPDLIEPLSKAAAFVAIYSFWKIFSGRAAHGRHGRGRLGYCFDTVLQVLPLFPLMATACVATQVTFDGNPDWPLWAVWSATLGVGFITFPLFQLTPVRAAVTRLRAADKAIETVDTVSPG